MSMRKLKGISILVIGAVVTLAVAYFGFKTLDKDAVKNREKIESEISENSLKTVNGVISEFGFKQINRDRAETNVLYLKLDNEENYFHSVPHLKSYYLGQNWVKNLKKGDSIELKILNSSNEKLVNQSIPIVELFYKNQKVLSKDAFVSNEVSNQKHWLEKTQFRFPNLILIIIFTAALFIFWASYYIGINKNRKS